MPSKPEFSFTLPKELIANLMKGCLTYEPIPDVPFNPQKGHDYNPHVAAWAINAIIVAYRQFCDKTKGDLLPENVTADATTLYWHEELNILEDKARCGYIGKINPIKDDPTNRIVIAFRGTEKLNEWLENLDYSQTDVSFNNIPDTVTIHKGFWDLVSKPATSHILSYIEKVSLFFIKYFTQKKPTLTSEIPSLLDQLTLLIPKYLSKTAPNEIYIAGHSLGAATATLVTLESILNFPKAKIITYVIGCPRVGGPSLSELFKDLSENSDYNFTLWRLTNTEDIVTTVPLPVIHDLTYSQLFLSRPGSPNTVGSIPFSDNLSNVAHNHNPLLYSYANKQLMSSKPEDTTK